MITARENNDKQERTIFEGNCFHTKKKRMTQAIHKVAINTGGGDAPGLNAVIRAVVHAAIGRGWECVGIRDGYNGLLKPEDYPDGGVVSLTLDAVRGITHLGGTILGTTNKGNPSKYPVLQEDGSFKEVNRLPEVAEKLRSYGVDALIAIGGDGSLTIADTLRHEGIKIIGVPKTIDNDLEQTITFGFDSAVTFATDCLDRLHTTAEAHHRVIVAEVMGRYAGWIALYAGVAGTADVILIPEIPFDIEKVAEKIRYREELSRKFSIIVVAEGARPIGGDYSVIGKSIGQAERLGGIGHRVGASIEALTGKETRVVVLGHLLRGGTPTTRDRLISLRLGTAAVRALAEGYDGVMIAYKGDVISYVPIEEIAGKMKFVPYDHDVLCTARELGIAFGD